MRDLNEQCLRQGELMHHMMERLCVDPAVATGIDGGLAWYEARTKCVFCPSVQRCREWLEGSGPSPGPAEFCPNAMFFQACFSEIVRQHAIVPTG
jgi:hypothetical protein